MRRSLLALLVLALLATFTSVGAVPATGAGLVTIYQDSYGVPHIVGETREAAAYGAGYVIGRDRLFLTDVIRRLGQGRLSEILGPGGDGNGNGVGDMLEADQAMRREFFDPADIERQYRALPDRIRRLLEAYADGMNTAIAEQTANPAEASVLFPALGYQPEPWRPQDSAAVLMLFTMWAFAGEGAGGELENAALLSTLIEEQGGDEAKALAIWQDLLLRNDPSAPSVVPGDSGPGPFVSAATPAVEQIALAGNPGMAAAARAEADLFALMVRVTDRLPVPVIGSYGFAAAGTRTRSRGALLLGAPQAGLLAPSLFYEFGLHAPGSDCTGFTVPGLGPFTGIGWCNGHAWTLVAGNAGDQVDAYVETLCGDGFGYFFQGECRPMTRRTEVYLVKTTLPSLSPLAPPPAPRVVTDDVYSTVHGPVFRFDRENGRAYVFKRAQAGHFLQTFRGTLALNEARSLEELEQGARLITATYNLLYADDSGNIAYRFTGWQPVRAPTVDHRLPTPGTGGFEWQDRSLPFEDMPHVTNPTGGIVHVSQGIDSKPVSWWPRASGIFVGRIGHTAADQKTFAGETALDTERVKALNRRIISDADTVTPRLAGVIEGALAGEDPGTPLGRAFAAFAAWRDAGYPRLDVNADRKLDDPAITLFGADYLGFPRSPVWDRFMSGVWAPADRQPPGSFVGRLGQTLAAIEEPTGLFSRDYSLGWQGRFREAMGEAISALSARFGGKPMSEWLSDAPSESFTAVGVLAPGDIKVVDHGSYSQIVDLGLHRGVNVMPPGNGRADRAADIALSQATGELPPHFADQVALYEAFDFKPMKMAAADFTADPESVEVLVYPGVLTRP